MNVSARQLVVVATALVVVAAAAALGMRADASDRDPGEARASGREGPLVTVPAASRGQVGPSYGDEADRPTSTAAQSKLWVADGSWWGALWSPSAAEWRIHWLEWSTQRWVDTGTPLDDRPDARIDVLWDGDSLVVAAAGHREDTARHALRVSRYRFAAGRRWAVDAGYPVTVVPNGVTDPTVGRDATGALWVSYVVGGTPVVARTDGRDARWGDPTRLPGARAGRAQHAALATFGDAVGVLWTEAGEDAVHVATRVAGEDWQAQVVEVANRGGDGNAIVVRAVPATDAEPASLVAAVQTLPERNQPRNTLGPGLVLLQGGAEGAWRTSHVATVRDGPGAPVLLVDGAAREVDVVTVSRSVPGTMYVKSAGLDDLVFGSGAGTPLVVGRSPASDLQDPTSTKQDLGPDTGLVVLVADRGPAAYLHGALALDGPDPGTAVPGDDVVPSGSSALDLVVEDFESGTAGAPLDPVWRRRSDDPTGTASVVPVAPEGLAGRLASGSGGSSTSVCRSPGVVSGDMTVDVDVLLEGPAAGGALLTSVRGDEEVARVRAGANGRISWWQGATQTQSEQTVAPGQWYRLTTTVHVATKTWDFILSDRARGSIVLQADGVPWRDATGATVDSVCLGSPEGTGAALLLDNFRVQR